MVLSIYIWKQMSLGLFKSLMNKTCVYKLYIHMCVCVRLYMCVCVCTHVCLLVHIYIYIYIYIYIFEFESPLNCTIYIMLPPNSSFIRMYLKYT